MNYCNLKKMDVANGVGIRVSLFVSGCLNKCEGCFNKEAWDFNYGDKYDDEVENEIIEALNSRLISGLTLLGGDPFEISNQKDISKLLIKVKSLYPEKTIWAYTGYLLDCDLVEGGKRYCEYTNSIINNIDILVDGKFEIAKKNLSLSFRGSSNQRIIDMSVYHTNKTIIDISEQFDQR